jgi:hypothetical protein
VWPEMALSNVPPTPAELERMMREVERLPLYRLDPAQQAQQAQHMHDALGLLVKEIPYKVAAKITSASFATTTRTADGQVTTYKFVVIFAGGKRLEFEAEGFPSDADIARVCLECP